MTKFKMNGKSIAMVLSVFAFMILGSVSATAQYVSTTEAATISKQHITTLSNDYDNATNDQERSDIAFEIGYYNHFLANVSTGGMEVETAIEAARPTVKPVVTPSGWISYPKQGSDTLKSEVDALIASAQDLLAE